MSAPDDLAVGTVGVIGPGRVGTVLGVALERAGHRVTAIAGGSETSRERAVRRLGAVEHAADDLHVIAGCELVIICVPDDSVASVVRSLAADEVVREGQRLVHVAGSLGLEALRPAALAGARTAACHPAQTVPSPDSDPDVLRGAAWAVTARHGDRRWAHTLVVRVGGRPVDVPEERRVLYHAGLVVGSNAAAAAVSVARRLLAAAGIGDPSAFLAPLVRASVEHVLERGADAITGPVVRGDAGTVRRHLDELHDADLQLAEAYRALTEVILAQVRPALTPEAAAALDAVIRRDGEV